MKNILATLGLIALLISCKPETKDKIEVATKAVGFEIEQKLDTVVEKAASVIDSTQAKAANALDKGAEKLKKAADKMEEASKK